MSRWYRDTYTQMRITDLYGQGYTRQQISRLLGLDDDMVQATIAVLGL